jgi:hypothetical protein
MAAPLDGRLRFDASQITLGRNDLRIERFAYVGLGANSRLLVSGDGSFSTEGDLAVVTPLITGAGAARHRISSAGALSLTRPVGGTAGASGGLGARLDLEGASHAVQTDILLTSGHGDLPQDNGLGGIPRIGFLQKPYGLNTLREQLSALTSAALVP